MSWRCRRTLLSVFLLAALATVLPATATTTVAELDPREAAAQVETEFAGEPTADVTAGSRLPGRTAQDLAGSRVGPLVPPRGALLGMWAKPRDGTYTHESQTGRWEDLEQAIGRRVDIAHTFYSWEREFPVRRDHWHVEQGRIPLISWNGTYTSEIAAGQHDAWIAERADAVRELGVPVFLRWFWEMDGNKKAHLAETPADYIAAWRHIRAIFEERGATNVAWVWCPNASAFRSGEAPQWYPGDAHVDWVCADGYNWPPGRPNAKWRDLKTIFSAFHEWGLAHGKPMMIGETGVQEREPGEKPAWFRSAGTQLEQDLPGISAFVYFDSDTEYPWWVDSTPASLQAFAEFANDPYMNVRDGAPLPLPSTDIDEPTDGPAAACPVTRLAGPTRIGTSIEVSRAAVGTGEAPAVVVARSDRFPDALAGGPLAADLGAPLLLTPPHDLAAEVRDEIRRVLPAGGTVHLLGGTAALGAAVEDEIRAAGFRTVRHAGEDRFTTAVAIAEARDEAPAAILLATGRDFPDALSAGAAAAAVDGVVLLTDGDRMPGSALAYLDAHSGASRYAVGGPAATAARAADEGATVDLVGADRYATAVRVADRLGGSDSAPLGFASGRDFADALVGAAHVGRLAGPLLLTDPASLPAAVSTYLDGRGCGARYVYGGSRAVSDAVADALGS